MAGIIFKWRYLKAGASGRHSENLIRYIAQREGVEKLDDSWKHRPVTKAQTELITQILSDYPDAKDSFEYQDYEKSRTAGAASEFITRAIEERVDLIGKRENYVELQSVPAWSVMERTVCSPMTASPSISPLRPKR